MKVSWLQINLLVRAVATQIEPHKIVNVYGIPRGGLVPAVMLSHLLEKPLIVHEELIGPGTLVVDELTDTGRQLLELGERLAVSRGINLLYSAVLHHSLTSKFTPTYFGAMKGTEYVDYPWELTGEV